jgi:hypothetical protein
VHSYRCCAGLALDPVAYFKPAASNTLTAPMCFRFLSVIEACVDVATAPLIVHAKVFVAGIQVVDANLSEGNPVEFTVEAGLAVFTGKLWIDESALWGSFDMKTRIGIGNQHWDGKICDLPVLSADSVGKAIRFIEGDEVANLITLRPPAFEFGESPMLLGICVCFSMRCSTSHAQCTKTGASWTWSQVPRCIGVGSVRKGCKMAQGRS